MLEQSNCSYFDKWVGRTGTISFYKQNSVMYLMIVITYLQANVYMYNDVADLFDAD